MILAFTQVTLKVLGCLHVGFFHRLMGACTHCGFQAEVRYAPVSWRLVRRPPAIAAVCRTANGLRVSAPVLRWVITTRKMAAGGCLRVLVGLILAGGNVNCHRLRRTGGPGFGVWLFHAVLQVFCFHYSGNWQLSRCITLIHVCISDCIGVVLRLRVARTTHTCLCVCVCICKYVLAMAHGIG